MMGRMQSQHASLTDSDANMADEDRYRDGRSRYVSNYSGNLQNPKGSDTLVQGIHQNRTLEDAKSFQNNCGINDRNIHSSYSPLKKKKRNGTQFNIFRYFSGYFAAKAGCDPKRIEAARQSRLTVRCYYVAAQKPTAGWGV